MMTPWASRARMRNMLYKLGLPPSFLICYLRSLDNLYQISSWDPDNSCGSLVHATVRPLPVKVGCEADRIQIWSASWPSFVGSVSQRRGRNSGWIYYTHGLEIHKGCLPNWKSGTGCASFEDTRSRVLGATLLVHCKFLIWPAPTIMVSLVPNITHITTAKHLQCCCVWGLLDYFPTTWYWNSFVLRRESFIQPCYTDRLFLYRSLHREPSCLCRAAHM
jgi:hypothetical protein